MPKAEEVSVGPCRVGYIVRGRAPKYIQELTLPLQDPTRADCILPEGHLSGFFYAESGFRDDHKAKICIDDEMDRVYRDVEVAQKLELHSTFLLFTVPLHQAMAFKNYWYEAQKSPPIYNSFLNNSATICYNAFIKSGILEVEKFKQISNTIMTPSRIHQILLEKYGKSDLVAWTGYIGISKNKKITFVRSEHSLSTGQRLSPL